MKKIYSALLTLSIVFSSWAQSSEINSISAITFSPEGTLFVGDAVSAKIFAFEIKGKLFDSKEPVNVANLEGDLAGLLGTSSENVLIHDMAVHPVTKDVYFSVSRGRAKWTNKWHLPNDLASADVLIRLTPSGEYESVNLERQTSTSIDLPNPVSDEKTHRWKEGTKLRVDAITNLIYNKGKLYISGLSNEEFSASMWVTPYPFKDQLVTNTLEIYHGAHGQYETNAPVRSFIPYTYGSKELVLAAYLCTPLVVFDSDALSTSSHVKGKTVAEFGSGNYPLDMVLYSNNGRDLVLMSNSQLPLLIFDPKAAAEYKGEIKEEVKGYLGGLSYTPRSGSGIQELEDFNADFILATQRQPNGKLALIALSKSRLIP